MLDNRYQVLDELGSGGMGEVYKGLDTRTNSFVAIKQLRRNFRNDTTVIERFRREAQALSDLNHPNIVKLLDMIHEDETYYLITEFIGGGDLANLLRQRGKLSVEDALKMGLELADALSRAHHLGIIHRDIKPANVLIADDGTPRLTDFGVAHMESQERLTEPHAAMGTIDYMPPEAFEGEVVDVRADVWAFGVMLYEMVVGQRPFHGTAKIQVVNNIMQLAAPDLSEDIPVELNDLIQQMLQKDRADRLRSVRQVGATLEAILQGDESGLRRLKTPTQNRKSDSSVLEDLPTTPGHSFSTFAPSHETRESQDKTAVAPPRNNRQLMAIISVIVVLGMIGFGVAWNMDVLFAPEPTPTPQPTATLAPIVDTAPEGFHWENIAELRLLVPDVWLNVPIETLLELSLTFMEDESNQQFIRNFAEQQRELEGYASWLDFSGMLVMIEDTGFDLPTSVRSERLGMFLESTATLVERPHIIQTHLGETLYTIGIVQLSEDENNITTMVAYSVARGTTLYTVGMSAKPDEFENYQEVFNTVLASIQIGEVVSATATPQPTPTVEATTEAIAESTPFVFENLPEGWQVAQGEHIAYAVPSEFTITPGTNEVVFNAMLQYVVGDIALADETTSLIAQNMELDVMAGNYVGDDWIFVGSYFRESMLSLNLEIAQRLHQALATLITESRDIEVEYLETVPTSLPAGESLRVTLRMQANDRAPFRFVYYIFSSEDGLKLYGIAFGFLETDEARYAALIEEIVQTVRLLD